MASMAFACLACLSIAGCGAPPPQNEVDALRGRMRATYSPETGRLQQLAYDLDNDGTADAHAYMEGTRLGRVEVDDNGDGLVDRWEYYDAGEQPIRVNGARIAAGGGPWPSALLARIDTSTRRDGKVSRREYYDHGVLGKAEEDTDGDDQIDKWETYVNGVLATVAFDVERRGVPTRRLVYGRGGVPDHMEIDPDGHGRFVTLRRVNADR